MNVFVINKYAMVLGFMVVLTLMLLGMDSECTPVFVLSKMAGVVMGAYAMAIGGKWIAEGKFEGVEE